ncbi:hypothetical protein FOA52_015814 [Chlamydomonas sp. UWO 241]|nr:hypothetical protein FOA52_015814 [Chlamydomonas sp. UWO 241]
MKPLQDADTSIEVEEVDAMIIAAAEAREAVRATSVAHSVLFSRDLWPQQLWQFLDGESRRTLRGTSSAMRVQVDACVTVVASPERGFTADQLCRALLRWPGVTHLSLLVGGDVEASALEPLTTTLVAGLKSLTLPQGGLQFLPEFSNSVVPTLQVIDASCCGRLVCIFDVQRCVQLRCLHMASGVWDLSPLAACTQLEELWMADALWVTSLWPLKACPMLRKLDLRNCRSVLHGQ